MKETNFKKRCKGLLALIMSFTMLFGSSIGVCASGNVGARLTTQQQSRNGYYDTAGQFIVNGQVTTPPAKTEQKDNQQKNANVVQEDTEQQAVSEAAAPTTHEHSFSWVVTVEPTENSDGLSEYICSCGLKDGSQPISAASAGVKQIVDSIRNAAEGEKIVLHQDTIFCYTAKIMKELLKRPDVSIQTIYTDKDGVTRSFTIPAGEAPTDGELFYGFTYLGNLYGWDEVE